MSGPQPHRDPPEPSDVPHDKTGQPETAPPGTPATGFPETPGADPGDISREPTPHTALNVPVGEPDPTEWPDPYDHREDPLGPPGEMSVPGDGPHPPTGATSTSQPTPEHDIEVPDWNAPDRDV